MNSIFDPERIVAEATAQANQDEARHKHTAASDTATVARLAALPRGDYDRARDDEAARLEHFHPDWK
jgi:hypothetical protein